MDCKIVAEDDIKYPKTIDLPLKNFKETRDLKEIVTLMHSGNWIVYNAHLCEDGGILFCLGELTNH